MKKTSLDMKSLVFFTLMAIAGFLVLSIFSRYLGLLVLSFVIVQIFHPVYSKLKANLKSSGVATTLTILLVLIAVIVPIIIITIMIVTEIQTFASNNPIFTSSEKLQEVINNIIAQINNTSGQVGLTIKIENFNFNNIVAELNRTSFFSDQLLPFVRDFASLSGEVLLAIFLMLLSLIYLFPAYEKIPRAFSRISPLEDDVDFLLIKKFKDTVRGVVKGTLVVAILQSTAVIIPFIILQVGAPALLWLLMVVLSIIPVGSGLVWGPVGIAIILNGISSSDPVQVITGIALIAYSAIIINVIDTTIRPKLVRSNINLHPLILIFSVLGGLALFGFIGILYGPLIVVLFVTIMEVYRVKYLDKPNEEN